MICRYCQEQHPDNAQFCPKTGKVLKNQCPNCDNQVKVGSKFCTYCGYTMGIPPQGALPAVFPSEPTLRSPWLFIILGVGGILVVAIVILLLNPTWFSGLSIFSSSTSTPTDTVLSTEVSPAPPLDDPASPTPTLIITEVLDQPTITPTNSPFPSPSATQIMPSNTPLSTDPPPPDLDDLLIAFNSNRTGNNEIHVMNARGKKVEQLTNNPYDDRVPSWSPNGDEIAFQSNRDGDYEIFIVDTASKNVRQVTSNGCNDYAPSWSPDGEKFAFYSDCDGNREIFITNVDGSNRQKLTNTSSGYNWFPSWSRDSLLITFASNRDGNYYVYVMNSDGSNQTKLVRGCVPSFSPDGQSILFSSYCTDDGDLFIMDRDGSNAESILSDYEARNPSWSPYGDSILFQSFLTGVYDIWTLDLDDMSLTQLTDNNSDDSAAVWQPATGLDIQSSVQSDTENISSSFSPQIVEPYCRRYGESPVYVTKNQSIILKWRWDAKTSDLVKDHIDSATYTILLDGDKIYGVDKSTIMYIPDENIYRVEWYSDVLSLSPGTHIGERIVTWDRMISDGWDTYGPVGEFETMRDDCEIIVS